MNAESDTPDQTVSPAPQPTKPQPQKPEFDFYSLLPEEEVVVPLEEEAPAPTLPIRPAPEAPSVQAAMPEPSTRPASVAVPEPAPAQVAVPEQVPAQAATPPPPPRQASNPQPPTRSGDYLLQLASFRRPADAETFKATLALQGVQTYIQQITIGSGETYYRVRTGSLGRNEATALKERLAARGQDALMVRVR